MENFKVVLCVCYVLLYIQAVEKAICRNDVGSGCRCRTIGFVKVRKGKYGR